MSFQQPYPPPMVNGNMVSLDANQEHPMLKAVKGDVAKHMMTHAEAMQALNAKKK